VTVDPLPKEGEKLLAAAPDEFVAERDRLAKALRDGGRPEDAAAIAGLRKPSVVVFAVNRAARDRPQAARDAAKAALRVKKTQVGDQPDAFREALSELDAALELLAEVAVAHVAPSGKKPTDAMRRRVRELLRSAAADDDARDLLARGALMDEVEPVGFSPFAGLPPKPASPRSTKRGQARADDREARKRERERELRKELSEAEKRLQHAERAVREAESARIAAERSVAKLRAKLEQSD
jgi:hypothetical protein